MGSCGTASAQPATVHVMDGAAGGDADDGAADGAVGGRGFQLSLTRGPSSALVT